MSVFALSSAFRERIACPSRCGTVSKSRATSRSCDLAARARTSCLTANCNAHTCFSRLAFSYHHRRKVKTVKLASEQPPPLPSPTQPAMTPPPDLEQATIHSDWKMEVDSQQDIPPPPPPPPVALEHEPQPPSPNAASVQATTAASLNSLPSIATFASQGIAQQQGQTRSVLDTLRKKS